MLSPIHKNNQSPTSPTLMANAKKPEPGSKMLRQMFGLNSNVSKKEFLRFFIFVVLLSILIFNNLDITNCYRQNTYFINLLSTSGFIHLLSPTYTVDLQTSLQTTVDSILRYNENAFIVANISQNSNFTVFENNLLLKPITDLRITQNRVETTANNSIVWKNPLEIMTHTYGNNNGSFTYIPDEGYSIFLPIFSTSNYSKNTTETSDRAWKKAINDGYFDTHTRIVKLDFAYISLSLNIMTYLQIFNEVLPSGVAKTSVEVRTFNFNFFGNDSSITDKGIQIAYVIFFAYYIIVMFIKVYYDIKHVEIDEEIFGLSKKSEFDYENKSKTKKIKDFCASFLKKFNKPKRFLFRVIIGLKRYLSQTNNLIDIFVNIMNFLLIIISLNVMLLDNFFGEYNEIAKNAKENSDFLNRTFNDPYVQKFYTMNNKVDRLSSQQMNYQIFCAMIAIVQCFKILSYLISFSSSLQRFFSIISNILDVLFFYLLLIAVIFLSFVLLVRNYYGYQIPEFTNIYSTSVYLFGMISGSNEYLTPMWNNSPEFTLFFHIAYNFIIVFILMNMFLVIVKNEFSRFQSEIIKKNENNNNDTNLMRFKYKPSFLSIVKEKLENYYLLTLYYINRVKYYQKKNDQKEKDLHLRNDINLYNHIDFDVNFVDMLKKYKQMQVKNTMVESEKAKINHNQLKESVKGIWQLFFLMIALGLYIFLVTEFFQTEENYALSSSVIQTLHKPYTSPMSKTFITIDVTKATNLNEVLYYLSSIFPIAFTNKFYYKAPDTATNTTEINETLIRSNPSFNEFMFLVNREIRFTIRKRQKVLNTNYFKLISPYSILASFTYDSVNPEGEFKEDYPYISYNESQSFNGCGGYVFFVNPMTELSAKVLELNEKKFFDETVNSITMDFILTNVIKNKFVYCLMVFQLGDTGGVKVIDLALPFRRINFNSALDICITILLSIIIFIYFIYVFKFVKAVVFKAESYQTWYSMFIKHTIPESLLYHRERKQPEILRKASYIFDFKSMLNLLFFIFTGVFIILMILLQVEVLEIENKANIFGTDLSEIMKFFTWRLFDNFGKSENLGSYINMSVKLLQLLDMVSLFAALSAFILVFQILYYYSKKKSFYVIIQSILISLREIPFMIAVLLSFLFTFAMYGFLLLGKIHAKFNSFPNALRTLFEYLSHIDDIAFFMQDSSMLAFLTLLLPFFLSVKLVIINMFFSIIYRAYEKSKIDGQKEITEEVPLGFKDFCVITYQLVMKNVEEKDNSLELYSQMLHKTDIEGLFLKMKDTIRISNQNTNIHIWANICSEEIRNEHEKRNFLREKCDEIMKNYFFKNSAGEKKYFGLLGRNLNKKCIEYELRKNYWNYFRIAHQHLNRYDFYFKNRINELNERLKNKEVIEMEKDKENGALKKYIADLMQRLDENKKDIAEVKQEIRKIKVGKGIEDKKEVSLKKKKVGRILIENNEGSGENEGFVKRGKKQVLSSNAFGNQKEIMMEEEEEEEKKDNEGFIFSMKELTNCN